MLDTVQVRSYKGDGCEAPGDFACRQLSENLWLVGKGLMRWLYLVDKAPLAFFSNHLQS